MASTEAPTEAAAVDSEHIQNIINMSMAQAFDVVSSWMLPPSNSASSAVLEARRLADEREIEILAMRPSRLGVGAALPTTASNKDTNRLRYKLSGNKRTREDVDDSAPAKHHDKGKRKADADDSESEEESRASAFKTPKVNGVTLPGPSPKKKRKKNKKGSATDGATDDATTVDDAGEWGGIEAQAARMDPPPLPNGVNGTSSSSSPDLPSGELSFTTTGSHLGRLEPTGPVASMNETPHTTPNPTISPPSSISSSQRANGFGTTQKAAQMISSNGVQDSPNGTADGSKKKRKKKKKKKSSVAQDSDGPT